jgi:hypothetical protein
MDNGDHVLGFSQHHCARSLHSHWYVFESIELIKCKNGTLLLKGLFTLFLFFLIPLKAIAR